MKINISKTINRIIKDGEKISLIAKEYGLKKEYFFALLMENLKNEKNEKKIRDMVQYYCDFDVFIKTLIAKIEELENIRKEVCSKHKITEKELNSVIEEYLEDINNKKLADCYKKYKEELESIFYLENILKETTFNFIDKIGVSRNTWFSNYKQRKESFFEYKNLSVMYNLILEVGAECTRNESNLIDELIRLGFDEDIRYKEFIKNFDLFGFKFNPKTKFIYHESDENTKELSKSYEAEIERNRLRELKYRIGIENNIDVELEKKAREKGLTYDEFLEIIKYEYLVCRRI